MSGVEPEQWSDLGWCPRGCNGDAAQAVGGGRCSDRVVSDFNMDSKPEFEPRPYGSDLEPQDHCLITGFHILALPLVMRNWNLAKA